MNYPREDQKTNIQTDAMQEHWIVESRQRWVIARVKDIAGCEVIYELINSNDIIIEGKYKIPIWSIGFRKQKGSKKSA